ncbi:YdeI/OmpD-associated family protein [Euzebya tangerina]|uniref:YdeI/OmpD-associated family protein n=1 Tax=Euzebya tangerina TaxID=591198 RepID=UPI000E31F825|nr:YdeI/OmpD-associated family protein [Euzebya tangerina]
MARIRTEDFETVEVRSVEQLRAWFAEHGEQKDAVWLVTWKKGSDGPYVSAGELLDEALCVGWMDGVRRKVDDDRTMQLFSPKRVSHWAKSYKDRVARLTEEGRMRSRGLAEVEAAKASGAWTFMDDVDALIAPPDLLEALDASPPARENYEAFPPSTKRNTLRWIKLAKTQPTREKRIAETARRATLNERVPNA